MDLTSQEVVALDLPGLDLTSVSQLWPVGDGTNVLLDSGTRLVITEPGSDAEPVPVALNCRAQMRDPGW